MDVVATVDTDHPPAAVFAVVEDLATYPEWLDIVPKAVADPDAPDTWHVDLRGRLGPFARSKRLRMVRTGHEAPTRVLFERREADDRQHSPWVLDAEVTPTATGSRLTMHLHYGGPLFGPVVERVLGDEIERSKPRLVALLESR
ncbi:MAG: SRPBCC family protein [Acidimicrobiales bacterium]